jgi:hypothetical protein
MADSPYLIDGRTGKYLGNLSSNSLDPNSVSNPIGRYGSSISPDSINNPIGRYGSEISLDSVNNPLATNPPQIWHGGRGDDDYDDYDYDYDY